MSGREPIPSGPAPVDLWAWLLAAISPIVGIIVVYVTIGMTTSGGDYCDPMYSSAAERDADYRHAYLVGAGASVFMIAVGVGVAALVVLRLQTITSRRRVRVPLALLVLALAVGGFTFLTVNLDFSSQCG